ncbi:MAG: hypothetical protein KDI55_27955, partial [Anaerolineae bacterium]|nr:hypothetical protein [Anaerolineae bacterium]
VVVSESFSIQVWNTLTWELLQNISEAGVINITWSPDSIFIAGVRGGQQESLLIWNVETGEMTSNISYRPRGDGAYTWISQCDWSPDGTQIATNSTTGGVLIWDISTADVVEISNTQYTDTVQVSWSPDSDEVATSSGIWDVQTHEKLHSFQLGNWLDWNPTGETLAIASWSTAHPYAVDIVDTVTGVTDDTLAAHQDNVTAVAWASDGRHLATMSLDQTIVIWDAQDLVPVSRINLPPEHDHVISWSPDNDQIATGGTNGTIYIWSLRP